MTRGKAERAQRWARCKWAVRCNSNSNPNAGVTQNSFFSALHCFDNLLPHMVDIRNKIQVLDVVSGKGAAGVIPTTINTEAGAESLPTIQEHISEAPTAAGIERQQQAGLQPEQPEHPQLSKSRRGEKTNPGVDCEPRSSAGQGSDNSSTTAWHVLSVPSLLWPTLSGSLALLCTTTVFIHFFSQFSNLLSRFSSLSFSLHSWWSLSLPPSQLCIDTCRKCEQVFPVTSWLPCPPLLNIPDCTSPNLSWMVGVFSSFCFNEFTLIRNHTLDPTRYLSRAHCLWRATLILGLLETLCPSTVSLPWARFQYYSHQYWYLPI